MFLVIFVIIIIKITIIIIIATIIIIIGYFLAVQNTLTFTYSGISLHIQSSDRQNYADDNDGCNDNYDGNFDDNDDKNDQKHTNIKSLG